MGIPYYFNTLYKKYSSKKLIISESEINNLSIEHLFFDYNSMIHPCAHQVLDIIKTDDVNIIEDAIISNVITYTHYILSLTNPTYAYIMIDGVAPMAKICQQRERRYKSEFLKIKDSEKCDWNSNKITPGTNFMKRLSLALSKFIQISKTKIYISDSTEPGEGEHKMMSYIQNNNITGNICIYGLDADLIMLSLINQTISKKIILLRDNTFNSTLIETKRTFTFIDTTILRDCIYKEINEMYIKETQKNIELSKQNIIQDYIFMCFLLGNDFLEHLPNLLIRESGINILLISYIKMIKLNNTPLICNNKINWKNFLQLLIYINEKKIHIKDKIYKDCVLTDSTFPMVNILQNDVIQYNKSNYKKRYYTYFDIDINNHNICKEYCIGLNWIWGYYNNHSHNNWSWHYIYHATPFICDLINYISNNLNTVNNIILPSICNTEIEQLYMVLPRHSLLEIIKELDVTIYNRTLRLFKTNSTTLEKYYPTKITIDMINKEWLWQAKIFFEPFDKTILKFFLDHKCV